MQKEYLITEIPPRENCAPWNTKGQQILIHTDFNEDKGNSDINCRKFLLSELGSSTNTNWTQE